LSVSKGKKTISAIPTRAAAVEYSRFRARFFPTAATKAAWWCWWRWSKTKGCVPNVSVRCETL
jgi:hypothetical protein